MAVCLFITGGEEKSCKSRPGLEPKHLAASKQGQRVCDATEFKAPVGRHSKLEQPVRSCQLNWELSTFAPAHLRSRLSTR
jgi:hypothetical protein